MGDKFDNKSKHKKKVTSKEKKAMNHLKLMEGAKEKHGQTTEIVANGHNKDKKAA